jgi:hypothetical protein
MRRQDHVILCALAACGGGGGFVDAPGPEAALHPGELSVAWTLADSNGATTCEAAGAAKVLVGITDNGSRDTAMFDCTLGSAITGALCVASYDVDFTLLDASGATVATAPAQHGVMVRSSETTKVATVAFVVGATAAVIAAAEPQVAALVARIAHVKTQLRGNLPGWETQLRLADAANDLVGLPPFTQSEPPGPAWRPSPATLLGFAAYARTHAIDPRALADRYEHDIAAATADLDAIDAWLARSRSERRGDGFVRRDRPEVTRALRPGARAGAPAVEGAAADRR